MICPCTGRHNTKPLCHTLCPTLKEELKNRDIPQRDTIMPVGTIYELLNIQGDPWELQSIERQAMISQAFAGLPKRQQQCLKLYFRDLMSCTELGRTLGVSRTTVRIHARRGLESIFYALEEAIPTELDSYFPPEIKQVRGYLIEGSEQKNENDRDQSRSTRRVQQAVTKEDFYDEDKFIQCA
ncbi:MAG: hypothetical protein NTV34_17835 [Proteobacteria bacterium]|nr:hypothetical protein [Pseudomonadota bacterium]